MAEIQKATMKCNLVSWIEVGFSTNIQDKLIEFGNGRISKGPDGGVYITRTNSMPKLYVASGSVIMKNADDSFAVMDGDTFRNIFHLM